MTGIPIVNVNNNCSTGSTALFLARQAIASGAVDCVLALGFEQMKPGRARHACSTTARAPFERFDAVTDGLVGTPERAAGAALLRRRRPRAHAEVRHARSTTFAKIRAKASRHAANNPLALFRKVVTADDVLASPMIWPGVMTRLMACPPTCGAAAAVLVLGGVREASTACARDVRIARAGDDDRPRRRRSRRTT